MLKIVLGLVSGIAEFMLISHMWSPFHSRIFFLPLLPMSPSLPTARGHIKKSEAKVSSASPLLQSTLSLSNLCSFGLLDDLYWNTGVLTVSFCLKPQGSPFMALYQNIEVKAIVHLAPNSRLEVI